MRFGLCGLAREIRCSDRVPFYRRKLDAFGQGESRNIRSGQQADLQLGTVPSLAVVDGKALSQFDRGGPNDEAFDSWCTRQQ